MTSPVPELALHNVKKKPEGSSKQKEGRCAASSLVHWSEHRRRKCPLVFFAIFSLAVHIYY